MVEYEQVIMRANERLRKLGAREVLFVRDNHKRTLWTERGTPLISVVLRGRADDRRLRETVRWVLLKVKEETGVKLSVTETQTSRG